MQFDTDSDMKIDQQSNLKKQPAINILENTEPEKTTEVVASNPRDSSRKRRPGGGRKRIHHDFYELKTDENDEQLLDQSGEPTSES